MASYSIDYYKPFITERVQKLQKLSRSKKLRIPHGSVLNYLGISKQDARHYLLCEVDPSARDEDYGSGLYILRARQKTIHSAAVCQRGGFEFTTIKGGQELPYIPSRSFTPGRVSYVFRKDITALLAQSRLADQNINVLSIPAFIADRELLTALPGARVYIFNDDSYWADRIHKGIPGSKYVPLPWGKDFFTWILEGGDIQKLVEYVDEYGYMGYHAVMARLLGLNAENYDGSSTELRKVADIRRELEMIPSWEVVAVHLIDDKTIELSWRNRLYVFYTKSAVLKYLSAKAVCCDAYAQRQRLREKGYSGILECTKLMYLALGMTSEKGTDWHLNRVEIPGCSASESILIQYGRLLAELEKVPAQYAWYELMRDAQIPLAHGYRMPYKQSVYDEVLWGFDRDERKWRETLTWVEAKRYGLDSLPVNLYPCGSVSGRFACREPAMQGVPKELRAAFFSQHGTTFVGGDISQCELRILAALSKDEGYLKIFESGDPHSETARVVLHKPEGEISKEERQIGKKVNLSIVYGIGNKKLAEDIGCTEKTARKFKQRLYMKYPKLKHWLDDTNLLGATTSFVYTPSGRRIFIDPSKPSYSYIGSNYVAQGTEMEIMLRAINSLTAVFRERRMDARVVHMIHDEVIVEARTDLVDEVKLLLPDIMTRAFVEVLPNAPVKNLIEVSASKCWGELKV